MPRRKRTLAPASGVPVHQPEPANDQAGSVFTVPELAKRWRVTPHTVTAAIKAGRLQAFKVGERVYRIREIDAVAFEQQQNLAVAS